MFISDISRYLAIFMACFMCSCCSQYEYDEYSDGQGYFYPEYQQYQGYDCATNWAVEGWSNHTQILKAKTT